MPKPNALDDDLEDDDPDPLENANQNDLGRPVRKLAAAILLRAVLDSKLRFRYYRDDATRFLYPRSEPAREHLELVARLAGMTPKWLNERLVRIENSPRLKARHRLKT